MDMHLEMKLCAICDTAQSILDAQIQTKYQRKALVKTVGTLLYLQKTIMSKIINLVPADCTHYSLAHLYSVNNYKRMTKSKKYVQHQIY